MKTIKYLFILLVAAVLVGGCGPAETPDEKVPEKPAGRPDTPPLPGGPTKAPTN